jgi:hypothetical protein
MKSVTYKKNILIPFYFLIPSSGARGFRKASGAKKKKFDITQMSTWTSFFKSIMSTALVTKRPLEEDELPTPNKRVKDNKICIYSVIKEYKTKMDEETTYVTVYQSNNEIETVKAFIDIAIDYLIEDVYSLLAVPTDFVTFTGEWRSLPLKEAVDKIDAYLKEHEVDCELYLITTRCHMF